MNLSSKLQTLLWFSFRPSYWRQAGVIILRKFKHNRDKPADIALATQWAQERVISQQEALVTLGLLQPDEPLLEVPASVVEQGLEKERQSKVRLGGAGDIHLLYTLARKLPARSVIETGVAYGWSSLAMLQGFADSGQDGDLVSVDMAFPKENNDAFIGIVVPDHLRARWTLLRMPDQSGIAKAIARLRSPLDLCHFDSDKSWWGRDYAYPRLWKALRPGGIFVSDDIQDNMYFAEFMKKLGVPFAVTEYAGKYIGLCRKPE